MIYLKILLRDDKVEKWMESEKVKISSILIILKKNLGYKNQEEIIRKTGLDSSFLRIKLCWRTDSEYFELCQTLNGIVEYFTETPSSKRYYYYRGRTLLDYVAKNGTLAFTPYYKIFEGEGTKSLLFWTLEKTIERWIKEKF